MTIHWKQELERLAVRFESLGMLSDLPLMNEFEQLGLYHRLLNLEAMEDQNQGLITDE